MNHEEAMDFFMKSEQYHFHFIDCFRNPFEPFYTLKNVQKQEFLSCPDFVIAYPKILR